MSTSPLTLPLDPTGSAASNLITAEVQTIGTRGTRAFPVNYGLFFRKSLVIKDTATNKVLVEGTQYFATQMDVEASARYGQEIDASIVVTDSTVGSTLSLTYQALGGPNSISQAAVSSAVTALQIDDAPATWASISNKPSKYPVASHQHIADDIYGMEFVVVALDRLGTAIQMGQGTAQAELQAYAEAVIQELIGQIGNSNAALITHTSDFTNPHKVTAHQIGSYTTAETTAAIATETSNRTNADAAIQTQLNTHTADHTNPHGVTTAQLGAYSKAQSDAAMTAMKTALQNTITANEATQNAHLTNYSNPHQVTAAQIGTWTTGQIASAVTAQQATLQTQVNAFESSLNAHMSNKSNPHGDTAANIGTWTYTTIQNSIVSPYSTHVNNRSNPHQVTVAQLGTYSATDINNNIAYQYQVVANEVNALNGTINAHVGNQNNPHGDNVNNTGGAYTGAYLQNLINSTLHSPG